MKDYRAELLETYGLHKGTPDQRRKKALERVRSLMAECYDGNDDLDRLNGETAGYYNLENAGDAFSALSDYFKEVDSEIADFLDDFSNKLWNEPRQSMIEDYLEFLENQMELDL